MKHVLRLLIPSLALVLAAWLLADAHRDTRRQGERITVKGTAERAVKSDQAVWRGVVSGEGQNRKAAFQQLEQARDQVDEWLASQGVSQDEVEWSTARANSRNKRDQFGNWTDEVASWSIEQSLALSGEDVERIAAIAEASSVLLAQGVSWTGWQPEFYISGLETLKLELIEEATANARDRAAAFVRGGKGQLGGIRSARQGVFQITAPLSTDMEGYGVYSTQTIDKLLKAVVTVEFGLDG
jgi:hypothetical protein